MTTVNPILLVATCEAVFKMAATSTAPSLPICSSGFGWDPQMEDCLPYSLCDTAPDTSICSDLPLSGGVSTASSTTANLKPNLSTENTHVCPAGYGWNQYNEDCQECSVCDEAPNTSICPYCHTVPEENHGYRHLGLALGTAASVFACFVLAALWYRHTRRARNAKDGDKGLKTGIQESFKTGIQETANETKSPGREEVLDKVTVM